MNSRSTQVPSREAVKRSAADMAEPTEAITLCCQCGVQMRPNAMMRCALCIKSEVNITEGISRQVLLQHCRGCERYNKPGWTKVEPESRELLGICLKKIKGIGKEVRLVDAAFVWTEEHSMRIRVKVTVQKEVANAAVLQQTLVVEFVIQNKQCEDCQKSFTPHAWNAIVQVRQKVAHRRSFCMLEQQILKRGAHNKVLSLKETREGLDFHFAHRSHATHFTDFIQSCLPARPKLSKHLVSHDANDNSYFYKYTTMCELCVICSDDLVYVPKSQSVGTLLSGAAPLLICYKMSTMIHLIDPLTLRGHDIPAVEYWKLEAKHKQIESIGQRERLTEFVVLDVEEVEAPVLGTPAKHTLAGKKKFALADIEIARVADFGHNDVRLHVRSHLGGVLRSGDRVLGYDLRALNVGGIDDFDLKEYGTDVLLVKKKFRRHAGRRRAWQLQRLPRANGDDEMGVDDEKDMEAVCQDLEENPELRKGVDMYRDPTAPAETPKPPAGEAAEGEEDEEDDGSDAADLEIPLADLLAGLELHEEDGGGGEEEP